LVTLRSLRLPPLRLHLAPLLLLAPL